MVASTPKTIALKGSYISDEALANEVLSPGHLVELLSTGKVQKADVVTGELPVSVAFEQEYLGKEITVAYAAEDTVVYITPVRGGVVYVRVPASAAAIVIGDRLEAATGGVVQKLASGVAVGIALEAVDNSGGGSEAFIRMRVL